MVGRRRRRENSAVAHPSLIFLAPSHRRHGIYCVFDDTRENHVIPGHVLPISGERRVVRVVIDVTTHYY